MRKKVSSKERIPKEKKGKETDGREVLKNLQKQGSSASNPSKKNSKGKKLSAEELEKEKNKRNKKKKFRKKVRKNIFLIILILICLFVADTFRNKNLLTGIILCENSIIYDQSGNIIAELGSERKQGKITIDKIPQNLKNAYIAIEDKRFYKHKGVDVIRTGGAIISYVRNKGNSNFGGSSITQQLIKNLTGDSESSIGRKVSEWVRATELETYMNKDEILEAYFNVIYVGPNIYGVDLGAKYYFNKDVSNLSLVECAYLAGINHAPYAYNPYLDKDNGDKIKKRTKIVLTAMRDQGLISDSEYKVAYNEVNNGINFTKGEIEAKGDGIYSYHTDALINSLIEDLSHKKKVSKEYAKNYIYKSGLKIYSNQDSNIQKIVESECEDSRYIINSNANPEKTTQAAVVIMDHKTGRVIACTGGLGKKDSARGLNRATQTVRQTGSAGKPIAVLVPALEKEIITTATIYNDEDTLFDDGKEGYRPTDYNGFKGRISVRTAVESSQNIPFVKIMEQITPSESIRYMRKMGVTSLTEVDDNLNLALGGLDKGISPLEMAGAYSAIANDGVYLEPKFYSKVETKTGYVVLEAKTSSTTVMSKQVSFLVKDLLKQPVLGEKGTAQYCKIDGMDVAAKTGTTNENYDRWLCGFTTYYTTVAWFGYDQNERIEFPENINPAGLIWANAMKKIHAPLVKTQFEVPEGIVKMAVCKDTGLIAKYTCRNTYTDYFDEENIPGECDR